MGAQIGLSGFHLFAFLGIIFIDRDGNAFPSHFFLRMYQRSG